MKHGDTCPTCLNPTIRVVAYSAVKAGKDGKPDNLGEKLVYGCIHTKSVGTIRTKLVECKQPEVVVRREAKNVPDHVLRIRS